MKAMLSSFHLNSHQGSIHRLKSKNHFVLLNKRYHIKELLNSFHLNGHTQGFLRFSRISSTQNLNPSLHSTLNSAS